MIDSPDKKHLSEEEHRTLDYLIDELFKRFPPHKPLPNQSQDPPHRPLWKRPPFLATFCIGITFLLANVGLTVFFVETLVEVTNGNGTHNKPAHAAPITKEPSCPEKKHYHHEAPSHGETVYIEGTSITRYIHIHKIKPDGSEKTYTDHYSIIPSKN